MNLFFWVGFLALFFQLGFTLLLKRVMKQTPSVPRQKLAHETTPKLSVIIPAFNEESNIGDCVRSVFQQSYPIDQLEVIVVNDGSTDHTSEVLSELQKSFPHLVVLNSPPRPQSPRFHGKNWACHVGSQTASGERLLFLDADVRLKSECLTSAVAEAQKSELGLLTMGPAIQCGCWAEWCVQPILFGFLMALFPIQHVNDPKSKVAFAAGPFMLFSKVVYEKIGGHWGVANEVVEDVALARKVKEQGTLKFFSGVAQDPYATIRMYSNTSSLWEGWSKNAFIGLNKSFILTGLMILCITMVFLVPLLLVLISTIQMAIHGWSWNLGKSILLGMLGMSGWWSYRTLLQQATGLPAQKHWKTPLGALMVIGILLDSALRVTLNWRWTWKGRPLNHKE